jgi:hypothetical protein
VDCRSDDQCAPQFDTITFRNAFAMVAGSADIGVDDPGRSANHQHPLRELRVGIVLSYAAPMPSSFIRFRTVCPAGPDHRVISD